jgi:hypothetical protein
MLVYQRVLMAMKKVKYYLYVDLYQLLTNGYDDGKNVVFWIVKKRCSIVIHADLFSGY